MITEIKKATFGMDGNPAFQIVNADVTSVEPVREGISPKTGEPWKVMNMNVRLNIGEDVRPDYMRLTIPTRLVDTVLGMNLTIGSRITATVSFSVTGAKYLQNDIRVLDLIKEG